MGGLGTLLRLALLLFLFVPSTVLAQRTGQDAYLRSVAEYFSVPEGEVFVLAQWRIAADEIPVVLFLSERAGVSPDVVVAQRRRGTPWLEIADDLGAHAGDFYVTLSGNQGSLADAYARFQERPRTRWSEVELTDREIIALVNVRFLSRFLGVSPAQVLQAAGGGGFVEAFGRLRGGGLRP